MTGRMTELSEFAAAALERGEDPLHVQFLREHEVTSDECWSLAERMAAGLLLVDALIHTDPGILSGALAGAELATAYRNLNQAMTGYRTGKGGG